MKFKVGDNVLFNWNDSIYSWIISAYNYIHFRQSKCTHAGKISRIDGDTIYIHEAIAKKGKEDYKAYIYSQRDLERYVSEGKAIIMRPNVAITDVEETCKSYEGFDYDWTSILLMPFKLFISTPKKVFCSEANARIDYDCSKHKLNIAAEFGIDYEKVTPMHFYLSKQYKEIKK